MATAPFKVSQSKVKQWRKCRQAYHYKYIDKLRRRRIKRPFKFGTIIHSMLEAHANGDDPFEVLEKISFDEHKLFAAEKEMYGDIIKDIGVIMQEYFDFWGEDSLRMLRHDGKYAEHEFNIEIAKDIVMTGKIDGVAKANKLKWLVEHKSFKKMPTEDTRWRNLQSAVYFRVIEITDWWKNLDGICWDYTKSKPPTVPQLLKSGELSEKNIDTLPSVVLRAIRKHKLNPKDYKKLITDAENNRRHYFLRIYTPINKPVVDRIFTGFVETAKEIAQDHGTKCDKNIDLHCGYCDYEPLCRAELTNSDVDFIKEREYYIDEDKKEDNDEKERDAE